MSERDLKESVAFWDAVRAELYPEFDQIWPRKRWELHRGESGQAKGIFFGYGITPSGEIRLNVTNAGSDTAKFEAAIVRSIQRVALRTARSTEKRRQREQWRSVGSCTICGAPAVAVGRSTCERCSRGKKEAELPSTANPTQNPDFHKHWLNSVLSALKLLRPEYRTDRRGVAELSWATARFRWEKDSGHYHAYLFDNRVAKGNTRGTVIPKLDPAEQSVNQVAARIDADVMRFLGNA